MRFITGVSLVFIHVLNRLPGCFWTGTVQYCFIDRISSKYCLYNAPEMCSTREFWYGNPSAPAYSTDLSSVAAKCYSSLTSGGACMAVLSSCPQMVSFTH